MAHDITRPHPSPSAGNVKQIGTEIGLLVHQQPRWYEFVFVP